MQAVYHLESHSIIQECTEIASMGKVVVQFVIQCAIHCCSDDELKELRGTTLEGAVRWA